MSHDVVVIGGGIAGAALTYELARAGAQTLLLDAGAIAGGASGATMGMVLWVTLQSEAELRVAAPGEKRLAALEDELNADLQYRRLPALVLAPDNAALQRLARQVERLRAFGLAAQVIDPAEIATIEPALETQGFAGALHAEQAHIDAVALTRAYLRAAERYGARVLEDRAVIGFEMTHGRITAARTARESFAAERFALAAGAWTRRLAASAGVDLPIYHIHGEAIATLPRPATLRAMVMVASSQGHGALERRVATALAAGATWEQWQDPSEAQDISAVQRADGCVLLGQVSRALPAPRLPVRPAAAERIRQAAEQILPALRDTRIAASWSAPVPFTPDQQPLIGNVPERDNLYVYAGFRSALLTVPATSERLARQISSGSVIS